LYGLIGIGWGIVELACELEAIFANCRQVAQVYVLKQELYIVVVPVKISHY
jgi:hypothetical protein